jgi:signal transduction histidine kinase
MIRLWPRSLAGRLIAMLLPAMVAAQVAGFVISADERVQAIRSATRDEFLMRTGSIARLIESTPPADHQEIVNGMAAVGMRFWLTDEPPPSPAEFRKMTWERLSATLPVTSEGEGPLGSFAGNIEASRILMSGWDSPPPGKWGLPANARFIEMDAQYGSAIVTRLTNGRWLNGVFAKPYYGQIWQSQSILSVTFTAVLLLALVTLITRQATRPLHKLSAAAEALGRGEDVAHVPEHGPDDIRKTAVAFNVMQDRLKRFLSDRTAMLAAIGHDLRTPITSLRLRAEFIKDPEERGRFLATLNNMQAITEASLSFARDQAIGEPTRPVDIVALTESICEDLVDAGLDVTFEYRERLAYRCRPAALGRAIRNLTENAVRYGNRARVSIASTSEGPEIIVDDDGPGIAAADIERAFKPFVRLEESRSRATGGTGLGLSIARTIARNHGGEILLANRSTGGLRAIIRLPSAAAPTADTMSPGRAHKSASDTLGA